MPASAGLSFVLSATCFRLTKPIEGSVMFRGRNGTSQKHWATGGWWGLFWGSIYKTVFDRISLYMYICIQIYVITVETQTLKPSINAERNGKRRQRGERKRISLGPSLALFVLLERWFLERHTKRDLREEEFTLRRGSI